MTKGGGQFASILINLVRTIVVSLPTEKGGLLAIELANVRLNNFLTAQIIKDIFPRFKITYYLYFWIYSKAVFELIVIV